MISGPRKDDAPLVTIEGVKERLAEPLDFMSIVLWKLTSALQSKHGSKVRQLELNDLEDLLSPYRDLGYEDDLRRNAKETEIRRASPSQHIMWEADYQRGRMRALIRLMKRNDLLPKGMI